MLVQKGTTNNFRFSSGMAGVRNIRKVDMAVVPYRGYSYAVRGRSVAKNVARQQKAFGFWRIKREKRAK